MSGQPKKKTISSSNNVLSIKILMSVLLDFWIWSCSSHFPQINTTTCPADTIVTHWIIQFCLQVMSLSKLGPRWSVGWWAVHWSPVRSWCQACCCHPACVPTHAKTPRQQIFHRKLKTLERWTKRDNCKVYCKKFNLQCTNKTWVTS